MAQRAAQAVTGLLLLVYVASTILRTRGETITLYDTWIGNLAYGGSAALCGWRALAERRDRWAWACLALSLAFLTTGSVLWTSTIQFWNPVPYPSLTDAFCLAFYPFAYVGLGLLIRAHLPRGKRAAWSDGLIAGLGVTAIGASFVLGPISRAVTGQHRHGGDQHRLPDRRPPARRDAGRVPRRPRAPARQLVVVPRRRSDVARRRRQRVRVARHLGHVCHRHPTRRPLGHRRVRHRDRRLARPTGPGSLRPPRPADRRPGAVHDELAGHRRVRRLVAPAPGRGGALERDVDRGGVPRDVRLPAAAQPCRRAQAGAHRRAHRARKPPRVLRGPRVGGEATLGWRCAGRVGDRSRSLQGDQRLPRPSCRRRGPRRARLAPDASRRTGHDRGAPRRRRVCAAHRGRGRGRCMLAAAGQVQAALARRSPSTA